jgi:hypothetical protein
LLQPEKAANKALILGDEGGFVGERYSVIGDLIYNKSGAIRGSNRVALGHPLIFYEFFRLGRLHDTDSESSVGEIFPFILTAEKP